MIVVGALIASYVNVNIVTPEYLSMQGTIDLQSILDSIMPCLLPLAVTFGMYGLVKKNVSPMVNILILVLIGIDFRRRRNDNNNRSWEICFRS